MSGMSLHPYTKGVPIGRQISILVDEAMHWGQVLSVCSTNAAPNCNRTHLGWLQPITLVLLFCAVLWWYSAASKKPRDRLLDAVLSSWPPQPAVNYEANVSSKNRFLSVSNHGQFLKKNQLLHRQRNLLHRHCWVTTSCNSFDSGRLQDLVNTCAKESLGKSNGFQESLSLWWCCSQPPEIAEIVIGHDLWDGKNSLMVHPNCSLLPPTKSQQRCRPCTQCSSCFLQKVSETTCQM